LGGDSPSKEMPAGPVAQSAPSLRNHGRAAPDMQRTGRAKLLGREGYPAGLTNGKDIPEAAAATKPGR